MSTAVKLEQAVLHILDTNASIPVISDKPLDISEEIDNFLVKHIEKIYEDGNIQKATFGEQSKVLKSVQSLLNHEQSFLEAGAYIASSLFDIMVKNVDIPSADLVVAIFHYNECRYLGIFKLNYRTGYSHYVSQSEQGVCNIIVKQKALLPVETQKIDECAIISLEDYNIRLIQKEYEINGNKEKYWSEYFLGCRAELSQNSKLKILDKAANKIVKEYFEEDFSKVAHVRKVMAESIEDTQMVKIEQIAEEVFKGNMEIKNEYIEAVQKAGIKEDSFTVPEHLIGKKIRNHRIKTDTGIAIDFPSSYFNDTNKIEFINNIDGTISIVIKNIGKIENR